MIFQHTHELVTSGAKTQTRRLWKPEWDFDDTGRVIAATMVDYVWRERIVYYVGQQLAVQPGRGKRAIARIEVVRLWREDVRRIALYECKAEGFESRDAFLALWEQMHGDEYDALAIEFRLLEGRLP